MSNRRAPVVASLSSLWVLLTVGTTIASAQGTPHPHKPGGGGIVPEAACPPEGCILGVSVTPDGGSASFPQSSGKHPLDFFVRNTGNVTTPFQFTCTTTGVTCSTITPTTASLAPGQGVEVAAVVIVGSVGGRYTLTADNFGGSARDNGFYNITVTNTGPPSAVVLRNQNGDNLDRSACLTSGAGESAAWECGDLVVTHAMPTYTTMNRGRTLTLLYHSAQAAPSPAVAVAVTQSTSLALPTSVYAELKVNGVIRNSGTYGGWNSAPLTRQLVLPFDAGPDSSGIYPFTLEVQNRYASGGPFSDTVSGTLIVVNRSQSRYGKGWSLAGVEELRLAQPGGAMLWIGGDASAKVYSPVNATTWVGAPGGYRDTLTLSGSVYTRTLRHGVRVTFDAQGRHLQTISRTGQATTFGYDANGRLSTITVPPGGTGTVYTVTYDATTGLLDRLTDPGGRVLNATVNGTSRVLASLLDPDNVTTAFAYNVSGRMLGRTGRRGFTTAYSYGQGLRLTRVAVPIDPATHDSAVTTFTPWDELGYPGLSPIDTALAFTTILGPRAGVADDAKISVDRWGAPTKIIDPIGATTTLLRGDAAVPLLVTRMTYPNPAGGGAGRIVNTTYDTRGNLIQVRDSTSHLGTAGLPTKVTRYVYGSPNTKDSPSQVIDSVTGQARTTTYTYTTVGLTNDVLDSRAHRTTFGYTSDFLVNKITELQVETWHENTTNDTLATKQDQIWTFDYDTKRNLKADTSATRVVRSYVRDTYGRVTEVHDPLGTKTERKYDLMDRDTLVRQYTAAQPNPYGINPLLSTRCDATQVLCSDPTVAFNPSLPATLDSKKTYGMLTLDRVRDPRGVGRDYAYDARNALLRETDDYGLAIQTVVDEAGLVRSTQLRSGAVTQYTYDAAGRRTIMRFPGIDYNGSLVPGDSIRYAYDVLGNLLTSNTVNRGSISRTYYANGLLKSKTATSGFPDVISYSYDQAWAVTRVIRNSDTTDYAYATTTGDLQTVTVRLGITGTAAARTRTFSYLWDGLGRLRQITYPGTAAGPMLVTYRYDAAGILRRLKSSNPAAGNDIFDLTLRNKSVDPIGRILSQYFVCRAGNVTGNPCGTVNNRSDSVETLNSYNRLSALAGQNRNGWIDNMRYDASGNMIYKQDGQHGEIHTFTIDPAHNRLIQDAIQGINDPLSISYDANGSRITEIGNVVDLREKHYFYDGLGRLSGTFVWVGTNVHNRPNDCQYDSDGQMAAGCEGAPWLGFDGHNVSGVLFNGGKGWSFFHGAGLDSPLMGYYRPTTGISRVFYWVTDGAGRELAVADSAGVRQSQDQAQDIGTWRQAGGVANSFGFSSDRQDNAFATNLSFFRNRFYYQNTGRWLQEDPIGVAGGLNHYQFNGNNPVSNTDPFGLCPPCSDRDEAIENTLFDPS
ncbi:MAG: RHS repeat-associated core domain-containing protein, partial [Gemmatimonadales bacterium]